MKCPKCGYLGFAQAERCRNCGYDFALAAPAPADLPMRRPDRPSAPVDDLVLIDAAAPTRGGDVDTVKRGGAMAPDADLPLFTPSPVLDATRPRSLTPAPTPTPRPPLSVRRATPDVARPQPAASKQAPAERVEPELEMPLQAPVSPAVRASGKSWSGGEAAAPLGELASLQTRAVAVGIDLGLMAIVDLLVVYFTLQVTGLRANEVGQLPLGPLSAYLALQNGAYLVAFTAGGQTIGKMLTGIRVVPSASHVRLDLGRAFVRSAIWTVLALPGGLGLLTAMFNDDRRGLHDRVAGTKVVRSAR